MIDHRIGCIPVAPAARRRVIREVAAKNIWADMPNRSNRKQRFGFSPWLYRQRNPGWSRLTRLLTIGKRRAGKGAAAAS